MAALTRSRSSARKMFHSVTINRDETFALFLTRDGVLHTVDLVSRAVAEVWKAPDPDPKDTSSVEFREWELNALRGSDLFLLERQFGEEPAILFNLADRSAVPLPKMPGNGWNGGWGEYALNIMNSRNELWNVRSGVRVPIPFPGPDMKSLCCDAKRSILYAFVGSRGVIAAIDLPSGHVIARMPVPRRDCSGHLTLSVDGKKLYWCAQFLRKADEPQREEGTIAGYDVSGIAKPGSGPSDAR